MSALFYCAISTEVKEMRFIEIGSKTHEESPWGFKPFCFQEAHQLGYQYVLWVDASIKIKHPLEPLFELISEDGYLIFQESHSAGEYCKDEALETLKITREESLELPCCRSGVRGRRTLVLMRP